MDLADRQAACPTTVPCAYSIREEIACQPRVGARAQAASNIFLSLRADMWQTRPVENPRCHKLESAMSAQSAACRESLAAVLERFMCPGGKWRLSPYVEATQCWALLGECPDPKNHTASLRELAGRPELADKLNAIAQAFLKAPWVAAPEFCMERYCLHLYFAHFFPANLGKLQLVLLDLLRAGQFPETLHLVDLGVGPGTTFLAVLDFVLALGAMADLLGMPLPLRHVTLAGYDRSPACLAYAGDVVKAFGEVLTVYGDGMPGPGGSALVSLGTCRGRAGRRKLHQADIGGVEAVEFPVPSLIVLSYVLHDLHVQGGVSACGVQLKQKVCFWPSGPTSPLPSSRSAPPTITLTAWSLGDDWCPGPIRPSPLVRLTSARSAPARAAGFSATAWAWASTALSRWKRSASALCGLPRMPWPCSAPYSIALPRRR